MTPERKVVELLRKGQHVPAELREELAQRASEVEELVNEWARLVIQKDEAHGALDLLEPCPPKANEAGVMWTVAGRIDLYREHMHEVWVRSNTIEMKVREAFDRCGGVMAVRAGGVLEWLRQERRR